MCVEGGGSGGEVGERRAAGERSASEFAGVALREEGQRLQMEAEVAKQTTAMLAALLQACGGGGGPGEGALQALVVAVQREEGTLGHSWWGQPVPLTTIRPPPPIHSAGQLTKLDCSSIGTEQESPKTQRMVGGRCRLPPSWWVGGHPPPF